ncbi:hypothetical protein [Desulfogranum japonicum]|uniref:hypothetical protein n=1 Tax=Desulfogranum japonicum TaxID=231447 RepID=UPI0004125CFF|nr:hypothetical protein [Desulfogranum japonicum]
MDIFLIDAIGPFFKGYNKKRINWSKIPFHYLDLQDPQTRQEHFKNIREELNRFSAAVSQEGYNYLSLDDVAHLAPDRFHSREINSLIGMYQQEYDHLFEIIYKYELGCFLTMDILSFSLDLQKQLGHSFELQLEYICRQIHSIFLRFPCISGVILRVGESDGTDVQGVFRSELILKKPSQVNRLLHRLLPVFEHYDKLLILRTWTVGAYKLGDFIWHRRTTAKVLEGIVSPCFILSMKFGETDFFRYLPLNKHFFRLPHVQKMIEFQARREYEGCGEYPSFIGWDYHDYAVQLQEAENLAGICVWCQTGGWVPFRRLTYLEPEGFWNELNSHVTVQIFRYGTSVEAAIRSFCVKKQITQVEEFTRLLQLDDLVIKDLLYIRELAGRKFFFRRIRIPPLLSVFWNTIFINHSIRKILQALTVCPQQCLIEAEQALQNLEEMEICAERAGVSVEDILFMKDTFAILALARRYYYEPYSEDIRVQVKEAKKAYKRKYPKSRRYRYRIKTNYTPFPLQGRYLKLLLKLALRKKRGYRLLDHLVMLHFLALLFRILIMHRPKMIPKFARKHAMGIETIFK